jgi:hypothetical protein
MTWEEQACILGIQKQEKSDYFHAKKEINTLSKKKPTMQAASVESTRRITWMGREEDLRAGRVRVVVLA